MVCHKALFLVLLFSLHPYDLPQMLPPVSTVLCVDDTAIFLSGKDPNSFNSSLQSCLDLANMWMTNNGLKLDASKTKCMLIHSSRATCSPSLNLHLSDQVIEQVCTFKFLGVYINDTLTLGDHVVKVISNVL